MVEAGAGGGARLPDHLFEEAGAKIAAGGAALEGADVVVRVTPPSAEEIERLPDGSVLIGFLAPLTSPETTRSLASAGVTAFAMEAIPRITRAQSMDALSSQATVGGYRAALIAAQELGRFFPMLTTAAGTISPPRCSCSAPAWRASRRSPRRARLGAQVTAFDVRSVVKEQVQSLGAKFLELDIGADAEAEGGYARELSEEEQQRQQDALNEALAGFDAVITTALIPGRPAPKLVTAAGVQNMRPGSVIVDLAGEAGGNCELSRARRDRRGARRDDRRAAQPALHDARPRLAALRAQRPVAARADDRRGGRARAQLRRRGRGRRVHHARRRDRPRGRQGGRRRRNEPRSLHGPS